MTIKLGKPAIELDDILNKVTELDILYHYFGISHIPSIINSPIRSDKHPSFGFYSIDGNKIYWNDFATKDSGGTFDLLGKYWGKSYTDVLYQVMEDLPKIVPINGHNNKLNKRLVITTKEYNSSVDVQCRIRKWEDYDLKYWEEYGITLQWLKLADIYPIDYKIVIKNNQKMIFPADKYAYAYVEFKEGKTTLKIYQPFNTKGYKWSNRHDKSVISLWTKVPDIGDKIVICSSMKDALCVWANTGIPAISVQGEGYGMSDTAINELKRRYKQIFILLDNDEVGILDGEKLAISTGFINKVLPNIGDNKDVSDLYKYLQNKEKFNSIILNLLR